MSLEKSYNHRSSRAATNTAKTDGEGVGWCKGCTGTTVAYSLHRCGGVSAGGMSGSVARVSWEISLHEPTKRDAQPAAQAGNREAARVKGEVGVLRSSVDPWASITHGERREGTYPHAAKRSKGPGDGSQELSAPNKVRELQIALSRKAKAEPIEVTP